MWKAEKIELNKHSGISGYFKDCYSLYINNHIISNTIEESFPFRNINCFEVFVCTCCGEEGCNASGNLMIRKLYSTLIFLPTLDYFTDPDMVRFEYDSEAPPEKWFKDGILLVEGEMLSELYKLLPELNNSNIPEADDEVLNYIIEWEEFVRKNSTP